MINFLYLLCVPILFIILFFLSILTELQYVYKYILIIIADDEFTLFESFKVDIKKTYEENVCFCPRESIFYENVFHEIQKRGYFISKCNDHNIVSGDRRRPLSRKIQDYNFRNIFCH